MTHILPQALVSPDESRQSYVTGDILEKCESGPYLLFLIWNVFCFEVSLARL